jgi:hypothetical protein
MSSNAEKFAEGSTQLTGTVPVLVEVSVITSNSQVLFTKAVNVKGTIVRGVIQPGEGFLLSSTDPTDTGIVSWQIWE